MGFVSINVEGREFAVSRGSDLHALLNRVNAQLMAGHPERALRDLDREWRTRHQNRHLLAPIYAHVLVRHGSSRSTAIALLNYALALDPGPDLEAAIARVLQRSGQHEAALHRVDAALRRYGLGSADELAQCARELVMSHAASIGWARMTPRGTIHAEAVAKTSVTFEARSEAGRLVARERVTPKRGVARVAFPMPPACDPIRITANGKALVGGELQWPSDFGVDGRAIARGRRLRGWVRVAWCRSTQPKLLITDEHGETAQVTATSARPAGAWGFDVDLRRTDLSGNRFDIQVLLPGRRRQSLPGAPFLNAKAARAGLKLIGPASAPRPIERIRPVDVIVPVYQDRQYTLACLQAIIETRSEAIGSIIVVDDCSPDPALSADLKALAEDHHLTLLRNERNLGFAASVNRAMELNPAHDAVLVNSDVIVFGDWLQRMQRAAYSSDDIGTITPLADDDSIVGYRGASAAGDPVDAARKLDEQRRGAVPALVDLPVGVGFCLYLRRDCWNAIGPLNVSVFGSGYGEEADFCMRARRAGWRHVLAANVFVHHGGSKSFGARRAALLDRSARLIADRHPGYHDLVAQFQERDPLLPIRRALDSERLRQAGEPITLIVTLALPGGVDRFVAERSRHIRAEGKLPLVLRPSGFFDSHSCTLRCDELGLADLKFQTPAELGTLSRLLHSLEIDVIELHHFLGLDPAVMTMVRELDVPIEIYIHDYAWICPRVTLIDGRHSYCGEPAVSACERCIRKNGSNLLETISVAGLRERSRTWLAEARRVIAPSEDTRQRLNRYFPEIDIEVVPHETFLAHATPAIAAREVIRVAILGAIGYHKGFKVLLECARLARARDLPLEFVVIGFSEDDELLESTGRIFITGRYEDREVASLLAREAPDLVFLPSVWPETWCYTLSHAISSGLPIVAFDLGAIGERLRAENKGTLLPLGMSPARIIDRLVELGRTARESGTAVSSKDERAVRRGAQPKIWNSGNG